MPKESALSKVTETSKQPAHQAVYQHLRDQVLFGELAPGQAVTIQGLAEQLGAGMTPVREGIRRLISAGALNMKGNRRVIVPDLSAGCIEELEFMRKSLEPELARRAAVRVSSAQIEVLRQQDEGLNDAIKMGDVHAYLKHNYRFHASLYQLAEAPIIAATVDRLWLRFGPSLRVVCGRYGTMNLPDKHAELLAALAESDAEAAAVAIADDVHQGMAQIRAALSSAASSDRFD